jgi:ABC-type nitrate/sulfonate/bicarbonate transport system substrate-binding protein
MEPLLIVLSLSSPWAAFSGEASPKPKSLSTTVKVGIPVFGTNSVPYFIAKEKGFYEEQGLRVDFILMQASATVAATASGDIDFTSAIGSSLGAALQGVPLKVVLTVSRKPKYWIFAKPDIQSMADLAGRTLASGTRGGDQYIETLFILEKFGLTGKVNVLPMAGFAARAVVNSLISGQIDAGYANESTYFELKDRSFRELVNYADHIEASSAGVAASQKLIDSRPEIVQAFVNASYRGMLFFKEHRSESIGVMARYMKLDDKSAARVYDLVIDTFGGDGTIAYTPVKKELEARRKILNLTAAVPPQEQLFDENFARKLPK